MTESIVPRLIENAEKYLPELQQKVEDLESLIEERDRLVDELERLEAYLAELKGGRGDSKTLAENVLSILKESNNDLSTKDLAERTHRNKKGVAKVMQELEARGHIVKTREEEIGSRYPRKYYRIKEGEVGTRSEQTLHEEKGESESEQAK